MKSSRELNIRLVLFAAIGIAYGVHRYLASREDIRTSTEMMRFVVTNDVIHFYGDRGHIMETNAEWARGLQDVSGETAFVTINEVWANGRRMKWRVEGVTKPVCAPKTMMEQDHEDWQANPPVLAGVTQMSLAAQRVRPAQQSMLPT